MDGVRYGLQQASWENSSALESYDPNLGSDLRGGGAYGDRGYVEGHFVPREAGPPYGRAAYPGEAVLDADRFPRHGWPPSRRRSLDEEMPPQRSSQRLEKLNQGRETYQRPKRDYALEGPGRDTPLLRTDPTREVGLERVPSLTGNGDRENADGDVDWEYRRDRLPFQDGREGNQDVDVAELPRPRSGTPSRLRRDEALGLRGEDLSPRDRSGRRSRGEDRDNTRRRRDRDYVRSRSRSRERGNWSPDRGRGRDRGRSFGHDDRDFSRRSSRSPRSRSRGAGGRESSYEDLRGDRRRDRESTRYHASSFHAPSATLVVKGLSQKINEDDLYLALADWGPLRHVRVIKERSTGVSRGFAFVDFPDVDAAQKMMDGIGYEGIVIDGRRICFEYSKPTGGPGVMPGPGRSSSMKSGLVAADWMCTVCGCNNFARRVLCFQCNEARTDESPAADLTAASGPGARRTSEAGPTHVLVVRGLDETVDEESLHCEFSKYAALKDLRLVRDKFTSVSRGFAFIHFHSVEDAAIALESTNGIALDKNGQLLRVAFAKSIGPASTASSHGSAAAAAAIEAATFAQQYDVIGWAPKEYNPGENLESGNQMEADTEAANGAPQSGFIWDEASGYYYDAASGFYYDGNRGLYYDGNSGVWYSYDQDTLQYTPYVAPESTSIDAECKGVLTSTSVTTTSSTTTSTVPSSAKAVIISAPAMVTIESHPELKKPTLAEAVAAAAEAAKSSAKKDKEKLKEKEREIRKSMIIGAGKKKMNNVMSVWKQRQHEGLAPEETNPSSSDTAVEGNTNSAIGRGAAPARVFQTATTPSKTVSGRGLATLGRGGGNPFSGNYHPSEGAGRARPVTQSSGRGVSVFGVSSSAVQSGGSVGRGTGRGRGSDSGMVSLSASETPVVVTPFKTDASALGAFPNASSTTSATRRRFSETPQSGYRDRAAERRSLYASSLPGDVPEVDGKDKGKDMPFPPGVGARGLGRGSDMPFPPGVGGGGSKQSSEPSSAVMGGADSESFEVITAEKALDTSNVGNRMLRNMGWQEGSGLGKEGTGIVEPVLAQGAGERAGLGSQSQQKKTDSRFETLPGDSYRIVIQKKALARFHEMI